MENYSGNGYKNVSICHTLQEDLNHKLVSV